MSRALSLLLLRLFCWFHHMDREPVVYDRQTFFRCKRCRIEWRGM